MPSDIDPAQFQLSLILTAAGATVAATIIASLIQVLKRLPGLGGWIDSNREPGLSVLLSGALVGYAYFATTPQLDAANGFAAFLAWIGVAGLAGKAYDVAPQAVKNALGGE